MVRLNHTTVINNKPVTPFLIQGSNVYCFNNIKETIILPLTSFKARKAKKTPIVPKIARVKQVVQKPNPEPPVEETIIIKPKMIHTEVVSSSIKAIGSADSKYTFVREERSQEDIKQSIYRYETFGSIKVFGLAEYRNEFIKPLEKKYEGIGTVQTIGLASTKVEEEEYTPPPVVDNNRFIRPTLDDDYI